jgi:hypothetical protein
MIRWVCPGTRGGHRLNRRSALPCVILSLSSFGDGQLVQECAVEELPGFSQRLWAVAQDTGEVAVVVGGYAMCQ